LFNKLGVLLFQLLLEFAGQVEQVIWIHNCSPILLAVKVDVCALQELLIEEDDDFGLSFSDDGTSEAKRHIVSLCAVEIHDSIANLEGLYLV